MMDDNYTLGPLIIRALWFSHLIYAVFVFREANGRMCAVSANMATPLVAYVNVGPRVQYMPHAGTISAISECL